jgi:ketosteroid isomerase-like protein
MKTSMETIQGIYKGDAEQIAKNLQAALAPRFEWTESAGFPYPGTFHSLEEVGKNVFARLSADWIDYRAEAENFYDAGDTIIVTGYYKGIHRASKGVMNARFAHIWTLKDGKVIKYLQNVDTKNVWDAIEGKSR